MENMEVTRFLKNEKLLDSIVKVVQSTGIIGEEISIRAEVLVCCGKQVINKSNTSTNLHPEDQSGVGKDFVTGGVKKIVFHDDWEEYHIPSPTAITYGQRKQEVKVNGKKMFKRERNQITSDTIVYIKDASEKFLNGDDAKLLFEDDVDITRTIDGKSCRIRWKKPVIIITTAETSTKNQLLRRVPSLPLNSSADQTKKIVDKQWANSCDIIKQKKHFDKINIQQEIARNAFSELKRVYVDIKPVLNYALERLTECKLVAMRTLNKRLIDYIRFSACLHQYQRKNLGTISNDTEKYDVIEATKQDVDIGYEIFNYIYHTEFADISFLNKRQRNIHSRLRNNPDERFSVHTINLWEESEGVTKQTTYPDLRAIARADPAIKFDETAFPKGFYYSKIPAVGADGSKKPDLNADIPRLKELKEFCKSNYDENGTVGYDELTEHFAEQFIGDVIQSCILSEVSPSRYHYNEVVD